MAPFEVADAALWLKEAEASNLKPNLIIYNSIISASARAGNPKQAEEDSDVLAKACER